MKRAELLLGWKSIPGYRHQVEGRENEDTFLVDSDHPLFDAILLVADGMGGHPEPKLASETAAGAAREFLFDPDQWQRLLDGDVRALPRLLAASVQHANEAVLALGRQVGERNPPGTTLSAAVIADGRLHLAHAGDGSALLTRAGRLEVLAGGESRRAGNRPQSFLGRADRVEMEEVTVSLQPGDRILLCTDGLTRYFGAVDATSGPLPPDPPPRSGEGRSERRSSAPPPRSGEGAGGRGPLTYPQSQEVGALHEVLGRPGADPQAIANQLTAHSRVDQYDDDTTVIVAEVVGLRDAPDPVVARPSTAGPRPATGVRWPMIRSWAAASLLLVAVAGAGIWGGSRWWSGRQAQAPPPASERAASATALMVGPVEGLPEDPLVLFDRSGRHLYALQPRARPQSPPKGTVTLYGARLLPGGQMTPAGEWRLDADTGRLTDPRSRTFYVDVDAAAGVITARHPGLLRVRTQPSGASVLVDGIRLGTAPLERKLPAGSHALRLLWRDGRVVEQTVEVPPRGSLTLELSP
jgi:protein phosphatase